MAREALVLIDTSSWVEALRVSGRQEVRDRVHRLMTDGTASWCDIVAVELWNGARGDYEKRRLAELEKEIICLETSPEVWQHARVLAAQCRQAGHTVPTADLVIVACALFYGASLEHCDAHMEKILKTHVSSKRRKA